MSSFAEKDRELRITFFTLLLSVFLVGLFGNIIVYSTFRKYSSLHTVTNLIIINMAATAVAHCLLNIPISLTYLALDRWPLGHVYCKVNGLTNSVCLFESMFSLVVLGSSRYWCIVHPTMFQAVFSKRHTLFMIALSWLLALILSSPPLFGWSNFQSSAGKMMCISIWRHSISYTGFITVSVFLVPSIAIIAVYYRIYKHIKSHERLLKLYTPVTTTALGPSTTVRRKHFSKSIFKDYQITKLIWTLFVIFVASWVPYFGVNLIFEFLDDVIPRSLDVILTLTTIFNTVCNPIIYVLVNRQFRKRFWDGIRCCKNTGFRKSGRQRRTANRCRDSTEMRSSWRTHQLTSRTQFHDSSVNGVICISAV